MDNGLSSLTSHTNRRRKIKFPGPDCSYYWSL